MTSETRYMLDANAFDYILDRSIEPRSVRRLGEIYITDVQHGELLNVPDPRRRKRLLRVLSEVNPTVRPASVGVRPDGAWRGGRAVRNDEPSDTARRFYGRSRRPGRWNDAAMGEVAALEGYVLVTDDGSFRARAIELGVPVLSCAEAFSELGPTPFVADT